jgi:hypothetical protein
MIAGDLSQNGTDEISKLAHGIPALLGITPTLSGDAFRTTPDHILGIYDAICQHEPISGD